MIIDAFLRRQMGRMLDVEVTEEAWSWIRGHLGVVRVVMSSPARAAVGREDILEVIDELRELVRANGQLKLPTFHILPAVTSGDHADEDYSRYTVLSRLAARDAAGDEELRRFRRTYFPRRPLDVTDLKSWIAKRYSEEARDTLPTVWLDSVPIPESVAWPLLFRYAGAPAYVADLDALEHVTEDELLERGSWQLLAYGTPLPTAPPASGQLEEQQVPTMAGTTLDDLRRLSCRLAQRYGWSPAQATTFIATGRVPVRLPINVRTESNERLPGLSVIHLAIDPGMSPKEVGDAYLEARKRLLGTRYRDLSEKHLALAEFLATQSAQQSWSVRMDRWNRRYGIRGWAYSQVANFSHDCLQAQRRLLRSEAPIVGPAEDATSTPNSSRSESRDDLDDSEEARHVETWAK